MAQSGTWMSKLVKFMDLSETSCEVRNVSKCKICSTGILLTVAQQCCAVAKLLLHSVQGRAVGSIVFTLVSCGLDTLLQCSVTAGTGGVVPNTWKFVNLDVWNLDLSLSPVSTEFFRPSVTGSDESGWNRECTVRVCHYVRLITYVYGEVCRVLCVYGAVCGVLCVYGAVCGVLCSPKSVLLKTNIDVRYELRRSCTFYCSHLSDST
jgi:hypothetical protein